MRTRRGKGENEKQKKGKEIGCDGREKSVTGEQNAVKEREDID